MPATPKRLEFSKEVLEDDRMERIRRFRKEHPNQALPSELLSPPTPRQIGEAAVPVFETDRMRAFTSADLQHLPPITWLIGNILEAGGLTILGGAPGSAKTFLAMDWAMSLAAGLSDWHGMEMDGEPKKVFYIMAEGFGGAERRVAGWLDAHPGADLGSEVLWVQGSISLVPKGDTGTNPDIQALEEQIQNHRPHLIVFDTFARVTPGVEENSAGQIGNIISKLQFWQQEYGVAVLFLHHSTKEGQSWTRGSGALAGAADVVMGLEKDDHGRITLTWKRKDAKIKNAEEPRDMQLVLVSRGEGRAAIGYDLTQADRKRKKTAKQIDFERQMEDDPEFAALTGKEQAEILDVHPSTITRWRQGLGDEDDNPEEPGVL